jgi:hypothetical protein
MVSKSEEIFENLCLSIEDKILERGLFTQYLGSYFEISIKPIFNNKIFLLKILIDNSDKKIKYASSVEMTSYIHAKFFELAEQSLSKEKFKLLEKQWNETVLINDGIVIFTLDD